MDLIDEFTSEPAMEYICGFHGCVVPGTLLMQYPSTVTDCTAQNDPRKWMTMIQQSAAYGLIASSSLGLVRPVVSSLHTHKLYLGMQSC